MLPISTILHPTDFSEESREAFRVACALSRDYGARLVVLHVSTPPVAVFAGDGVTMMPIHPADDREQLWDELRQIKPVNARVAVEHRLLEGDAATEIVRAAKEIECDMVVMGTHGRSGLGKLLLGSVAEHVLRNATCPVLTIRRPNDQSSIARANKDHHDSLGVGAHA